jgi:oxygen-independent coproporphyrinogen-3 oxidase
VITTKNSPESIAAYLAALEKEIQAAILQYGRLRFDTLYLGGGTPSALPIEAMSRLTELLRREFHFKGVCEMTCEVNPGDTDAKTLKGYHSLGINRISVGAQSFNDALLKDMGRLHTAQDIVQSVSEAKAAGFENVSLDLIIRLPGQTLEDVSRSLQQAVELDVDQVAVFDLDLAERTVYGMRRQRGELRQPDEELHHAMMQLAEDYLESQGYRHYELTSFAKPGFESHHNLIYWHNQEYLGLGPGAFSYLKGLRYQFAQDVNRYLEKCGAGNWTRDVEDRLSEEEKEMETFLTGLRLQDGVDLSAFKRIGRQLSAKIKLLEMDGFFEHDNGRLTLSRKGRFVSDHVFAELAGSVMPSANK